MRVVQVLLAALVCLWGRPAAASSLQNLERVAVSGSEYVRLAEWADANDFELKWPHNGPVILLTNPTHRLEFGVDSRRAQINGVTVWLNLPVVNRGGAAMISLIDLRTTLHPILFPHSTEDAPETICLDPGHGGLDKGEINGAHFEKTYALLLADDVADDLRRDGFKVVLTRTDDRKIELPDRPAFARQHGADLFISLHYNSAASDIRGVEVYCITPPGLNSSNEGGGRSGDGPYAGNEENDRSVLLAYELERSITHSLPLEDRGMKRSRFEVLREAHLPAILIEGGFMSNPGDSSKIYDPAFRRKMAHAVAEGVLAYKHAIEKPLARK